MRPMFKVGKIRNLRELNRVALLYQRGDEAWLKGRLRSAFKYFLAAAKAGMTDAFAIVGQFYDRGDGVEPNEDAALYWYRRAYRSQNGDPFSASNIGCIWRDRGRFGQALLWFKRAVDLGNGDANLNIAKVYLHRGDAAKAARYLYRTSRSAWATEGSKEESRRLLKELKTSKTKRSGFRA